MNYRNEAEFNHMWGETGPMEYKISAPKRIALPTAHSPLRRGFTSITYWAILFVIGFGLGMGVVRLFGAHIARCLQIP